MIRLLRRFQPQNAALATLYWLAWFAVAVGLLFLLYYYLDTRYDFSSRFFNPSFE